MKVVEEKKKLFEEWLKRQDGRLWERYSECERGCKFSKGRGKMEMGERVN